MGLYGTGRCLLMDSLRAEYRLIRDLFALDYFPTICGEVRVEHWHQRLDGLLVLPNQRMDHLAQETKKQIIWPVGKIKPGIREDPIIGPVIRVADPVLCDIAGHVMESVVRRRYGIQVIEPCQELGFTQATRPLDVV